MSVQNETFSAYLRDRYKSLAVQIDKDQLGTNNLAIQAQYQMMMMNMMLMNMQNSNPGNLWAQSQQVPPAGNPKGNLFVRKAKGRTSEPFQPEPRQLKPQRALEKPEAKAQDVVVPTFEDDEEQTRGRFDSESFPALVPQKKQIMTDPNPKVKGKRGVMAEMKEGKVTRAFLIEYFMKNKDNLKINEKLANFTEAEVPILDKKARPRIEEVTPTPKKEYVPQPPANPNSGPSSRKGSINYKKDAPPASSNNRPKNGDNDEYVRKKSK